MRVQLYNVVLFLAEMKRFELLRRFEPTYRISSASGISELSGIWWKMREPAGRGKTQCFGRFWEGGEAKKQRFSGREVITAAAKF